MHKDETKRVLRAGAARVVITPPVGIRMLGYTVQECVSESVERDLTATALVLTDGRQKLAVITCDLAFIQEPHAGRIRRRVADRLGISPVHVLISCSHTHLGPMLPGWQPDTPEQEQCQSRYLAVLEDALAGVAAMADRRLEPARIGAGTGHARIGINRREKLPDGRVVIGENPEGPVDHDVSVIRVDDLHGRPIAVVMSAAAHTVVLGPRTAQLSPDYVGPAREIVESASGALSLFCLGAAGNVNPACGIGSGGPEQYDDLHRLGARLGGEVLSTWSGIRTHNRHGPRRIVQSVAAVSVWEYEPLPDESIGHFQIAAERLTLPLAPLPDGETAQRQAAEYRSRLDDVRRRNGSPGEINVAQRLVHWSQNVLEAVKAGQARVTREVEIWGCRINDLAVVAVSGEPFAELGLEVKRRSPVPQTFFFGYSNGCVGYLPTPEAFAEGGMEVHESHQNYMLPAPTTPEWGPAIVQASLRLLKTL